MLIGIDIDGVCADFIGRAAEVILDKYGMDIFPILAKKPKDKESEETYNLCQEYIAEVAKDESVYKDLKAVKDAAASIKDLIGEGFDIVYITSRPEEFKEVTLSWLRNHGFPHPEKVVFTNDKGTYCRDNHLDWMIEDRLPLIDNIREMSPDTMIIWFENKANEHEVFLSAKIIKAHCWSDVVFFIYFPRK